MELRMVESKRNLALKLPKIAGNQWLRGSFEYHPQDKTHIVKDQEKKTKLGGETEREGFCAEMLTSLRCK